MENQNLNNVEQNQNTGKPQKSGNGKTVALVVILLILMLVIGLLGGMMLSDKGFTFINQKQEEVKDKEENKTNNNTNKSEENEKNTEKTNTTENNGNNETTKETKNNNSSSNTNTQTSTETIWYTSDAFKIKLPKSWENKYKVDIGDLGEDDGGDSYNFRTVSDDEYLFSIEVRNTEFKADFMPHEFLGSFTEGNNVKYVYMIYRTDAPANAEPHTSMMKDFEAYKDDVYVKQTFGNKTFYAKDFLQIEKGSMYRYYRYYIDEQDRLCILNYEKDVTIEIIASDVDKLTYDENENVIHAYPRGKSFVNNIARDVEEIVFENIN